MYTPQTPRRAPARALGLALLLPLIIALLAACGAGPESDAGAAGDAEVADAEFTCPEPNPRLEVTSEELNLFVWTEYIPDDAMDCFEEVYGITVNRDEYSSNEEMYAKLSAGGSSYDLAQPTDYIVPLMIRQGVVQELDKSKLPVLEGFDPKYLDFDFDPGNKYSVPYQAGTDAIVVNTDVVETMPTAWADLWNEEYAGRMVFLDDSRAVIALTLLTLGEDPNSTDPAVLDRAKEKLAELVPSIKLFDSDSPKTALIAGDVDLGMTWTGEAFLAQQENPAIEYIYPSEGAILWQDNYVVVADAPHPDAAYAWLNYTLQPELFWMMLRDFPYSNPSAATLEFAKTNHPELYEAYMASNITNTPAEAIEAGHRIEDVGDSLPLYDAIWTEVKGQ
ncbi:MAG: ABC transporter substrate-binding protein [Caldilineaceae bacterium]